MLFVGTKEGRCKTFVWHGKCPASSLDNWGKSFIMAPYHAIIALFKSFISLLCECNVHKENHNHVLILSNSLIK